MPNSSPESLSLETLKANWYWQALQEELTDRREHAMRQLLTLKAFEDPQGITEAQETIKLIDKLIDPDFLKELKDSYSTKPKEEEDGS